MIVSFKNLAPEHEHLAGTKGSTLAMLSRADYRVPDGFIILPAAFSGDELEAEAWTGVQAHLDGLRRSKPRAPAAAAAGDAIRGVPGTVGVVEGPVRLLHSLEEGGELQPAEILVTSTVNIGWTLLFPRAAAIVTDLGAPLSHAAIVARELGIPAVVGCGYATMRLQTGDWVRVDGAQGEVTKLT